MIPLRPHRSRTVQAIIFLVRWSVEIAVVVGAWVGARRLHEHTGWSYSRLMLTVAVVLGVVLAVPPTRRLTVRSVWVAVTRHRLRAFFVQGRVYNRTGRLPWIVAARPTAVGERLWVWMIPGLSVLDLQDSAVEEITAACWARTTRVERHRRVSALVVVDVVRRDPLSGTKPLLSTLLTRLKHSGAEGRHARHRCGGLGGVDGVDGDRRT